MLFEVELKTKTISFINGKYLIKEKTGLALFKLSKLTDDSFKSTFP